MDHKDNYAMSEAADWQGYRGDHSSRQFFVRGWMDERSGSMCARLENPDHSSAYYAGYFAARGTPRPDVQAPGFIFIPSPQRPPLFGTRAAGNSDFGRKALAA